MISESILTKFVWSIVSLAIRYLSDHRQTSNHIHRYEECVLKISHKLEVRSIYSI